MVARRILVPPVRVRILPRQQKRVELPLNSFLFLHSLYPGAIGAQAEKITAQAHITAHGCMQPRIARVQKLIKTYDTQFISLIINSFVSFVVLSFCPREKPKVISEPTFPLVAKSSLCANILSDSILSNDCFQAGYRKYKQTPCLRVPISLFFITFAPRFTKNRVI